MASDPDFDVQHRDCYESLQAMADAGGADLILTSPPYPDARSDEAYGASFDTSLEGYAKLGDATFEALKPGGVCALNIDGPVRQWRKISPGRAQQAGPVGKDASQSERCMIAFKVAIDWAERVGLRFLDPCAYRRAGVPQSRGPRWRKTWEPVLVFSHPGAEPHFDRWGYTRLAKHPGSSSGGSTCRAEGDRRVASKPWVQGDRRCLNNSEYWEKTPVSYDHAAPFSSDMADAYVRCYSPPGGLVGDPFTGSGTVAYAVHRAGDGRTFTGGDLGIRQTHNGKPCGRRWADIVNDGLRQGRLF